MEGAEFTERELDAALRETPEQLRTRSQRQARAAVRAYRWISEIPPDRPVDEILIREIHRKIVTGADDDPVSLENRAEAIKTLSLEPRNTEVRMPERSVGIAYSTLRARFNMNSLSTIPLSKPWRPIIIWQPCILSWTATDEQLARLRRCCFSVQGCVTVPSSRCRITITMKNLPI